MNAILVSWSLKVGEEKKERPRESGREMSHAAGSTILPFLPLLCWWTPRMQSVQWAGQNKLGINKTIDTTTGCTVAVACVGGKWHHSEAAAVWIRSEIQLWVWCCRHTSPPLEGEMVEMVVWAWPSSLLASWLLLPAPPACQTCRCFCYLISASSVDSCLERPRQAQCWMELSRSMAKHGGSPRLKQLKSPSVMKLHQKIYILN